MSLGHDYFDDYFKSLTSHGPFPWQRALFERFLQGQFPRSCDIPTGLGKTATIAIWILALAHRAGKGMLTDFPRRLVYVVNRRTVVDQATREAEFMREALCTKPELQEVAKAMQSLAACPSDAPLAISTLRGQFADNAEWRNDPARPAVILGTVDMIGSRLLFAGYGRGFKSRPLHAAFIGQETLLIHDEAHLEPAFQELISVIENEQNRCEEFRRFRVLALTATARDGGADSFGLTEEDRIHPEVKKRLEALKGIKFHPIKAENQIPDKVAELALKHKDSGKAVLVFLLKLEHVEKVAEKLNKAKQHVQILTGTFRGLERDNLVKDGIFVRFMPNSESQPKAGTVFLVCTSAGEVGVNISADHLVCDLTPFDSMAQRFGRVNRFGDSSAQIDIVHCVASDAMKQHKDSPQANQASQSGADPGSTNDTDGVTGAQKKAKSKSGFDLACELTLSVLHQLPKGEDHLRDASPIALGDLPAADRKNAFTPTPVVLPASDILFDSWALTSIREKLPGRPPVADWLHGMAEWEPPETHVAWRDEVGIITGDLVAKYRPEDLLEDYPLKPHELLRDRTDRVFGHLEKIAERCPAQCAWLIESYGEITVLTMAALVEKGRQNKPRVRLVDSTVLLSPEAGGLKDGMLDGGYAFEKNQRYDVSDHWSDQDDAKRRYRTWDEGRSPNGMRLVRTIDTWRLDEDKQMAEVGETGSHRYWRWYVRPRSADDDGSRTASQRQELVTHLQSAERFANAIVEKLGLGELEASAVRHAARWHDRGKDRSVWQRSIGNPDYPTQVLAKSGGKMRPIDLSDYRHEMGSLLDVSNNPQFKQLSVDMQDLVLHLIGAHHGRARPHFSADEAFDPKRSEDEVAAVANEVPRRFGRLQRRYGRWGLAYLESLVRAADALASQTNEELESEKAKPQPITNNQEPEQ